MFVPTVLVDWASLAQQWIKMKETLPTINQGPLPPPAPTISKPAETVLPKPTPTASESYLNNDIEGGEAPMDMDTKDDEAPSPVGVATGTCFFKMDCLVSIEFGEVFDFKVILFQEITGTNGVTGNLSGGGGGQEMQVQYRWERKLQLHPPSIVR